MIDPTPMPDLAWKRSLEPPHSGAEDAPRREVWRAHPSRTLRLVVEPGLSGHWLWFVEQSRAYGWVSVESGPKQGDPPIADVEVARVAAERLARQRGLI